MAFGGGGWKLYNASIIVFIPRLKLYYRELSMHHHVNVAVM
jgi:hypothetical protein